MISVSVDTSSPSTTLVVEDATTSMMRMFTMDADAQDTDKTIYLTYEESMKKRQPNRNNILCVCGHYWSEHGWAKFPFVAMKWNECYGSNENYTSVDGMFIDCSCDDYRQDNLSFLQEKYESKKRPL